MLSRGKTTLATAFLFGGSLYAMLAQPPSDISINHVTIHSTGLSSSQIQALNLALKEHNYSPDEIRSHVIYSLKDIGYFRVTASAPMQIPEKSGPVISVNQGARYRLRELQVRGATAYNPSRLRDLFPFEADDFFGTTPIGQGLNSIMQLYSRAGYLDVTSVPMLEVDDARHTIAVTIDIHEGPRTPPGP